MIRGAALTNDGGELFVELIDLANPAAAGYQRQPQRSVVMPSSAQISHAGNPAV